MPATAASNQLDSSTTAAMPPAKASQVVLYFVLLFLSQILSVYCAFVSLPYPNLSYWESYQMVIPYSWGSWVFMTKAIEISNNYHIFDRNKMFFLLIITQFALVMLFNRFSWGANRLFPGTVTSPPTPPAGAKQKQKQKNKKKKQTETTST